MKDVKHVLKKAKANKQATCEHKKRDDSGQCISCGDQGAIGE